MFPPVKSTFNLLRSHIPVFDEIKGLTTWGRWGSSRVHHVVHHHLWRNRDGHVGLGWNVLEQLLGAVLHALLEGCCVSALHVVHHVEVAHLVIRGTSVEEGSVNETKWRRSQEPFFPPVNKILHIIQWECLLWCCASSTITKAQRFTWLRLTEVNVERGEHTLKTKHTCLIQSPIRPQPLCMDALLYCLAVIYFNFSF